MIREYKVLNVPWRGAEHTKTVVSADGSVEEPIDETFSPEEIVELLNHHHPGYEWVEAKE